MLKCKETLDCDVLVIGGGGAGLRSAIAARSNDVNVLMVSKSGSGHATNTSISKAVIASSGWGVPEDNPDVHIADTIESGRFLNDRALLAAIAEGVGAEIAFLQECGVNFQMEGGKFRLFKIGGHRYSRHVRSNNWIGSDLVTPLRRCAKKAGVRFEEHVFITRLIASGGRITGATGVTRDGDFLAIRAKTVILATGGYAQIFLNNNNAAGITGDGQALSYDLGVPLKDMEFIQFYPTATGKRGGRILLYETLLPREGVVLRNGDGEDIIKKNGITDPTSVTRDQLAQLVIKEIRNGKTGKQSVVMDTEALSEKDAGPLAQILLPSWWKGEKTYEVAPTAHFCMGGIVTDPSGETSLGGLFSVGEATGGAHGANRLGGNALAEIFAMGTLAGTKAARQSMEIDMMPSIHEAAEDERLRLEKTFSLQGSKPSELIKQLKTIMWRKVGIIREKNELEEAHKLIKEPWPTAAAVDCSDLIKLLEFNNMRLVAEMVCKAALERTESRGSHFRADYPEEDNERWLKNIVFRKGDTGMRVETVPVGRDIGKPA